MSPSTFCLSFETSVATSPFRTVEFFQTGTSSVDDTMYLGMLFSRSKYSPLRDGVGDPNHSSLRRPSSNALARNALLVRGLNHGSGSLPANCFHQPPRLNPSSPPGSW